MKESRLDRLPLERSEDWPRYLGRKISIRYRLHGDEEHPFSEAIGVIAAVAPDRSSIDIVTRRHGTLTIAVSDIVAGKAFPI